MSCTMELRVVRPGGTIDNSPAIYRWVRDQINRSGVPEGRLKGDVTVSHSYTSCLYILCGVRNSVNGSLSQNYGSGSGHISVVLLSRIE